MAVAVYVNPIREAVTYLIELSTVLLMNDGMKRKPYARKDLRKIFADQI